MFKVRIKDDYNRDVVINFPFEESELAEAMNKMRWKERDIPNLSYQVYPSPSHLDAVYEVEYQGNVIFLRSRFFAETSVLEANILARLTLECGSYDFARAKFYNDNVYYTDALEFANVVRQIDESLICSYEYSSDDEDATTRLGYEIANFDFEINDHIPDEIKNYIDYERIGEDYSDQYYYDEDFYMDIDYDDLEGKLDLYEWEDFEEWDNELFKECLHEEAEASNSAAQKISKLLEILEAGD